MSMITKFWTVIIRCSLLLFILPLDVYADVTLSRLNVAPVWAGHYVKFSLITDFDFSRQYVAYYDVDRNMTIASRKLNDSRWEFKKLPSVTGWDSHNYIALGLDEFHNLHVSGNMHSNQLVYFRTKIAGDISSLIKIDKMTGLDENSITYPHFIKNSNGHLLFYYRDGVSGDGNTIFNEFDAKRMIWHSLMDKPLFSGDNKMNAYPEDPILGPDGYWHIIWVWRSTRYVESTHDINYIKSKDLIHWSTVNDNMVVLPITDKNKNVVVDLVPKHSGLVNGNIHLGFDNQNNAVVAYTKLNSKGYTEIYLARYENNNWHRYELTKWKYNWLPVGGGSIDFNIKYSSLQYDNKIGYFIWFYNKRDGEEYWRINPETLSLISKIPKNQQPNRLPKELYKLSVDTSPDMKVHMLLDEEQREKLNPYIYRNNKMFLLRWETKPLNRDLPLSTKDYVFSNLELIQLSLP